MVDELGLPHGTENSLVSKLQNAQKSLEGGGTSDVCGKLGAFDNELHAQLGKKVPTEAGQELLSALLETRDSLGCD
jgi:hypothetical protein